MIHTCCWWIIMIHYMNSRWKKVKRSSPPALFILHLIRVKKRKLLNGKRYSLTGTLLMLFSSFFFFLFRVRNESEVETCFIRNRKHDHILRGTVRHDYDDYQRGRWWADPKIINDSMSGWGWLDYSKLLFSSLFWKVCRDDFRIWGLTYENKRHLYLIIINSLTRGGVNTLHPNHKSLSLL